MINKLSKTLKSQLEDLNPQYREEYLYHNGIGALDLFIYFPQSDIELKVRITLTLQENGLIRPDYSIYDQNQTIRVMTYNEMDYIVQHIKALIS